ncbi:MAG: ABC transporter permease [Clostridia bacterium]|nr:ABC transporter permease [Clostridia bacterium]
MKFSNIMTTYFKEIRTLVRDRKTIIRIVLMPLLIPLIFVLYGFLYDAMLSEDYTIGINYELSDIEKQIIETSEDIEFTSYANEQALKEAYEEGEINGYIVRNDNNYTIYADESSNSGLAVQSISESYLSVFNDILGSQKLAEYGIDPNEVFSSINIESISLADDNNDFLTTMTFSFVMAYIAMIICLVAVNVVTDATAGEKERGTLETILTFPIKSYELVVGKYLASASACFVIGLISYLMSIPSVVIAGKLFEAYENSNYEPKLLDIMLAVFIILLTSLVVSGVCMALAGRSKTYKEAQASLTFVSMLPMIPLLLSMAEISNEIVSFIPIANCSSALIDIALNKVDYHSILTIIASTVVYTALILMYVSKQYKSEKTLFA